MLLVTCYINLVICFGNIYYPLILMLHLSFLHLSLLLLFITITFYYYFLIMIWWWWLWPSLSILSTSASLSLTLALLVWLIIMNYYQDNKRLPYVGKNITCIRSLIGYLHILAIHVHRRRLVSLSSEPSSGEPPRRAIIDDARIWQSCLQTVAVT